MRSERTRRYRLGGAVVFGLLGFGLNFFDLQLIESEAFKVNILLGLFFPLLVSLAWGWRYGLISALAGGAQSMWWLWSGDGWGMMYAVPVFTLWIVWHGWWAERREEDAAWYRSVFVVEIPFRVLSELGFYTVFRWLVSLNPPPWNSAITENEVSLAWVNMVVIKHVLTGYILLLAVYSVLSLGGVRRFFGLPRRPGARDTAAIYTVAILAWVLFWFGDAWVDFLLFNPASRTFWEMAVLQVEPHKVCTRSLVFVVAIAAAAIIARQMRHKAYLNRRLAHLNRVLAAIRNVNQLITHESDRDIMLKRACRLLVETRGFLHAWIALADERQKVGLTYYAGAEDVFAPMASALASGYQPLCAEAASRQGEVLLTKTPIRECAGCPMADRYRDCSSLTMVLRHRERVYGWLSVSLPTVFADDVEERHLLAEVGEDIAYALWSMESKSRLETLEHKFAAVLASSSDAVIAGDLDGAITLFNAGAERLFGCSAEEALGTSVARFCPEDRRAEQKVLLDRVLRGGMIQAVETERLTADGRRFSVEMTIDLQTDEKGMPCGYSAIMRDVSERKRAEQELLRAKDAAEVASQAKSVFLANMSHELRTPLNPIMGFTELVLAEAELVDEHRGMLEVVSRRSRDLLQLLTDLLDITRIESRQMPIRVETIDISSLVQDVVGMFEHTAADKGITLDIDLGPALPGEVQTDPMRVRQILLNLLGNALKFTAEGHIQVAAALDDGMLSLSVRDTGCGIAPEQQDLIYETFQQVDNSSTRQYGGAGLGLAICKRLVTLMGGTIRVESALGEGSTFYVKLPVGVVESVRSASTPEALMQALAANKPLRILLVEDDYASRILTERVLTRSGHLLTCVGDGQAAVNVCRDTTFDLILMDIRLPVMNGLDATRALRAQGCRVPIIAVTACAFDEDEEECLAAGMDAWVTKPVNTDTLMQAISRISGGEAAV